MSKSAEENLPRCGKCSVALVVFRGIPLRKWRQRGAMFPVVVKTTDSERSPHQRQCQPFYLKADSGD